MVFDRQVYDPDTVVINSQPYRIVRDKSQQAYTQEWINEPPWVEGDPPLLSDPAFTWHLGGFKSRQGVPGSSEYGQNTDGRWPFKLLPGPLVQTATLTNSADAVVNIIWGLDNIWVFSGPRVWRISSSLVVTLSDEGLDAAPSDAIEWNGAILSARTNRTIFVNSSGAPDTWGTVTATALARQFAKGFNRLFKLVHTTSYILELKNLPLGSTYDPTDETDWADAVTLPGSYENASLVEYDRTVLAASGKYGIFGVGEDGFGIPIARRLKPTGKLKFIEPYVYIPHANGLARFVPGDVESIGIEHEIMNESPVRGEVKAVCADSNWLYATVNDGTNSYILAGRERRGSEPGFGPMVWDTLLYIPSVVISVMEVINTGEEELLMFNNGVNVSYVVIPFTGGSPAINSADYRFALSGIRYSTKYNFDDRGEKDFPKFSVKGSGLSANVKWAIAYNIDGGGWNTTDINGDPMEITSDTLTTFFLPITAHGVEIQYRFTYTSNTSTSAGSITYFEPFFSPRPRKVSLVHFILNLEEGQHDAETRDTRTGLKQLDDLRTLLESATPIVARGPWKDGNDNAVIKNLELVDDSQSQAAAPVLKVKVSIQIREAA